MMRRILIPAFLLACLLPIFAAAQDSDPPEVYVGYSYMRTGTASRVNAFNNNGGLGALQYNLNENFSIVAEFGEYVAGRISLNGPERITMDQKCFSYQFGLRFSPNRSRHYEPFVHYLLGGVRQSRSFAVPNSLVPPNAVVPPGMSAKVYAQTTEFHQIQNALAQTIGGGLDINLTRRFGIRLLQVDYLPALCSPFSVPGVAGNINDTDFQHNLRFSVGLKFRLAREAAPGPP